jgi:hypothetical protein
VAKRLGQIDSRSIEHEHAGHMAGRADRELRRRHDSPV